MAHLLGEEYFLDAYGPMYAFLLTWSPVWLPSETMQDILSFKCIRDFGFAPGRPLFIKDDIFKLLRSFRMFSSEDVTMNVNHDHENP